MQRSKKNEEGWLRLSAATQRNKKNEECWLHCSAVQQKKKRKRRLDALQRNKKKIEEEGSLHCKKKRKKRRLTSIMCGSCSDSRYSSKLQALGGPSSKLLLQQLGLQLQACSLSTFLELWRWSEGGKGW